MHNWQAGKTNRKQSSDTYFIVLVEEFRQRLDARSDKHQGIAAKNGKSLLDSELGEINDVIGRKCLGSEALCSAEVLYSLWQRSKIYTHTAISKKSL